MTTRPLIIIHGWSDSSASFRKLAQRLEQLSQRKPLLINLADFITMDDNITYEDIVTAMMRAWQKHDLPEKPYSVDVICHSTGALVVRHWLQRYFNPETAPIKHLLMLAPANFGSPLAHKGRTFYGRVLKGLDAKKLFQVGSKLLRGLELASPYTWRLAMNDRFGKHNYFGKDRILCTVLIGNKGYSGIAAAANEIGGDGTVRISSANLNAAHLSADFTDAGKPIYHLQQTKGKIAFAILDGENHSTIAKEQKNQQTLFYIQQALAITDEQFNDWCQQLKKVTQKNSDNQPGFQNTVFFVDDQYGNHVQDYFLEFYGTGRKKHRFAELFHGDIINTVHVYQADNSYRSLYFNCTQIHKSFADAKEQLVFNLTAEPAFSKNNDVGYKTVNKNEMAGIQFSSEELKKIFVENRTLLVSIKLKRWQSGKVFEIKKYHNNKT